MNDKHYDVIIIGGRCAGASLAIRLGQENINTLLVDRMVFPSRPSVPSAPVIHAGTMVLLDEIGLDASDYARAGSRIDRMIVDFANGEFDETLFGDFDLPYDHCYGIDRSYFDNALWKKASSYPSVNLLDGCAVTHILKDESGKVTGVKGKKGNAEHIFSADIVVGADGRFSFAARGFGASITEEKNDHTSAVYVAEFSNVDEYGSQYSNALCAYNTGKGLMVLVIPIASRTYHIGVAIPTKSATFADTGHEAAYYNYLKRIPTLWQRIENAERITDVVGIKRVENGYRQAYGEGWALVGDAVHYKDPSDGQGIYDALLGSKLLAKSIIAWKCDSTSWDEIGQAYQEQLLYETHPTFLQTVANVKQNLYTQIPDFLFKLMNRGLLSDPMFKDRFMRYTARQISPDEFQKIMRRIPLIILREAFNSLLNIPKRSAKQTAHEQD